MRKKIKSFLCSVGFHWLKNHKDFFTDVVSGNMVYLATCDCSKEFMVDSKFPIPTFKVETDEPKKTYT